MNFEQQRRRDAAVDAFMGAWVGGVLVGVLVAGNAQLVFLAIVAGLLIGLFWSLRG
jgi:predicted lipid-binding transport protein (Tim44 family)